MRAAFVADGGGVVGLGHLSRCLAVAQALKRFHRVAPVFFNADPECRRWVRNRGFPVRPSFAGKWDIVVADSYRFTRADLKKIGASTPNLLFFDDVGRVVAPCEWVLNSSVAASLIDYRNATAKGFLLGPQFHPLRKEFLARGRTRPAGRPVKKILVILGGGDGGGALKTVVPLVRKAAPRAELHVVVGPFGTPEIGGAAKNVRLHRSPANLRGLMASCDAAVSAGGQTLYELAYLGVPTVAIQLFDNQKYVVQGFVSAGSILFGGGPGKPDFKKKLARALKNILGDGNLRQRLSGAGQACVDGRGAARVAHLLASS